MKSLPSVGFLIKTAAVAALVLVAYNKVPAFARILGNPNKS